MKHVGKALPSVLHDSDALCTHVSSAFTSLSLPPRTHFVLVHILWTITRAGYSMFSKRFLILFLLFVQRILFSAAKPEPPPHLRGAVAAVDARWHQMRRLRHLSERPLPHSLLLHAPPEPLPLCRPPPCCASLLGLTRRLRTPARSVKTGW